jgi:hypothetical protein
MAALSAVGPKWPLMVLGAFVLVTAGRNLLAIK